MYRTTQFFFPELPDFQWRNIQILNNSNIACTCRLNQMRFKITIHENNAENEWQSKGQRWQSRRGRCGVFIFWCRPPNVDDDVLSYLLLFWRGSYRGDRRCFIRDSDLVILIDPDLGSQAGELGHWFYGRHFTLSGFCGSNISLWWTYSLELALNILRESTSFWRKKSSLRVSLPFWNVTE